MDFEGGIDLSFDELRQRMDIYNDSFYNCRNMVFFYNYRLARNTEKEVQL